MARNELLQAQPRQARSASDEALELARAVGDTWSISLGLFNLGLAALAEGDPRRAQALLAEALENAWRRGDKRVGAECVLALAAAAAVAGETEAAARLWGASRAARERAELLPSPVELRIEQLHLAPLGPMLGEDPLSRAYDAGGRADYDETVAAALTPTRTAALREC